MNNPNVILRVDGHTRNCADEPAIRQLLRPQGINFERRNIPGIL